MEHTICVEESGRSDSSLRLDQSLINRRFENEPVVALPIEQEHEYLSLSTFEVVDDQNANGARYAVLAATFEDV